MDVDAVGRLGNPSSRIRRRPCRPVDRAGIAPPRLTHYLQRPDSARIARGENGLERPVSRPTILIAALSLALAPAAHAESGLERALAAGGELVSLEGGRGYAAVTSRNGAMLGRVGAGRIVVKNFRRGTRTERRLWGCEVRKRIARRTVLCAGRNLSFSVVDGRWRAILRGNWINASAVVEGRVMLRGTAGTYSIAGGTPRAWPRQPRMFRLG